MIGTLQQARRAHKTSLIDEQVVPAIITNHSSRPHKVSTRRNPMATADSVQLMNIMALAAITIEVTQMIPTQTQMLSRMRMIMVASSTSKKGDSRVAKIMNARITATLTNNSTLVIGASWMRVAIEIKQEVIKVNPVSTYHLQRVAILFVMLTSQ